MIDHISQAQGILLNTIQSKALIGIGAFSLLLLLCLSLGIPWSNLVVILFCAISAGSIGEVPILLAKPQAYMNFSGESVCSHLSFQQLFVLSFKSVFCN